MSIFRYNLNVDHCVVWMVTIMFALDFDVIGMTMFSICSTTWTNLISYLDSFRWPSLRIIYIIKYSSENVPAFFYIGGRKIEIRMKLWAKLEKVTQISSALLNRAKQMSFSELWNVFEKAFLCNGRKMVHWSISCFIE